MTSARGGSARPTGARIARRRLSLPRDRAGRRSLVLTIVYLLAFAGIIARLVHVQVVDAERWADRGAAQRARTIELAPSRGRIYDRQGEVLATSVDAATIYADPRAFKPTETPEGLLKPPAIEPDAAAAALAPVLGMDAGSIAQLLRKDAHFVYLARQREWKVGEQVAALDLPGIGVLTEPRRLYPGGLLASQLLGFTGIDGNGLWGLEQQHDSLLRGRPGQLAIEQAPGGLAIASGARELLPPQRGTDLVLTIDREIQHTAERVAAEVTERYAAKGASIVVLEVGTGEILAMASAPGFDANRFADSDPAAWRNRAVTDVFEPGSVQKAITAAAAIEEGVVTPDSILRVDDEIEVGGKRFSDAHEHEPVDMTFREVIETSSNVGTIEVAQRLGPDTLYRYLTAFGYGQRLGVGFPGEQPGLLMPVDQWWRTSLPTIAIGQGVAMTLLQTASFYATIANDGVAVQPRIMRGTVGEDGRLSPASPPAQREVVSPETARKVRSILGGVVQGEQGTGKAAAVAGYDVAGKTGTARKPNLDARGYSGEYIASFAGFAPVDDPRLVVAVMVDEPWPIWGGVVAAPAFSEVMEFALVHRRVPPTRPQSSLEQALDEAVAAAQAEGPATAADAPGSPPVGTPVEAGRDDG